jgi:glycosyl transferase family 2
MPAARRPTSICRPLDNEKMSIGYGQIAMIVAPTLLRQATRPSPASVGAILGFLTVRDEVLRLPAVLEHHRQLGVDQFFIVDNGSSDGTREFAAEQSDVNLYSADGSFAESYAGFEWLRPLQDEFASGKWALTIDADELFIYPHCEQVGLRDFCGYLDGKGVGAVFSILLDMYSDRMVQDTLYSVGGSLLDACPYFDPGPYRIIRGAAFPPFEIRGGPRARVFWNPDTKFASPSMSKVPLVRWRPGYRYVCAQHFMQADAALSEITGALLHFKFLYDFHERARREVLRGEHFDGAKEYKLYLQKLDQCDGLTLHYDSSMRFENSDQLVNCKLMQSSSDYDSFRRETLEKSRGSN